MTYSWSRPDYLSSTEGGGFASVGSAGGRGRTLTWSSAGSGGVASELIGSLCGSSYDCCTDHDVVLGTACV